MKDIQEFKLIDGTFSIEEAEKILLMLFNYKIEYHSRDDFSKHVRFNDNINKSQTRIHELIATREEIRQMLAHLKSKQPMLVIQSSIKISLNS